MNSKLLLAVALVMGVSGVANAAEFFVMQDTATKKCTIVEQKPTTTSMTVVGPAGKVYTTRTEAEAGMKTIAVCSSR
jgi:hypothetical protein